MKETTHQKKLEQETEQENDTQEFTHNNKKTKDDPDNTGKEQEQMTRRTSYQKTEQPIRNLEQDNNMDRRKNEMSEQVTRMRRENKNQAITNRTDSNDKSTRTTNRTKATPKQEHDKVRQHKCSGNQPTHRNTTNNTEDFEEFTDTDNSIRIDEHRTKEATTARRKATA